MTAPVFESHAVPFELTGAVAAIWYFEGTSPRRFEKVLPRPRAHLIVNLSGPYRQVIRDGTRVDIELRGPFVSGVQTRPLVNENPESIRMVAVELYADALSAFAAAPKDRCVDRIVSAEHPFPGMAGLVGDLMGAPPAQQSAAVADLLLASWRPECHDPVIGEARSLLEERALPIAAVAEELGVSARSLYGRFVRACGMPPKRFADVSRFARLISALESAATVPSWSEFIAEHGYYDQGHGIRAFSRYAGLTPRRFVAGLRQYGLEFASFVPMEDAQDQGSRPA